MGKKAALLAVALAVAGLCILLWPVVSGHRLQADMSAAAQGFLEEVRQSYPELLADLQGYNQRIYTERQAGLADALACEEPAVLLRDCGVEDEIIGVLEIPTLELVMPVYLGASDSHLAAGAAVLGNTSAPIGGVNTNCVIAGHSKVGLPQSNDLFARIAVLHDQITGIAGQFIVDNVFCRCAGFNDFPNLRKIGSCVVAAVFTGDHSALDDLGKIFPFCIIQNRGQFSGTPVFRPVGTGPAYILKTFIFRGNEMTHVLSLP